MSDLGTHRDRAIALAMLLGGLRAGEARLLRLADVNMGLRRVRVVGKGGQERVVPIDRVFFAELAAYLRTERPEGLSTAECFVVLRGPTTGQPLTEAGLRKGQRPQDSQLCVGGAMRWSDSGPRSERASETRHQDVRNQAKAVE
ncbi:MAG: tyrosine-type recombinase/integrase [Haloechinothrix sp.]